MFRPKNPSPADDEKPQSASGSEKRDSIGTNSPSKSASQEKVKSTTSSPSHSRRSSVSSSRSEPLYLGVELDEDDAIKYAKDIINAQVKNLQGHWKILWGDKITENSKNNKGLLNLGLVIGEEFIIDKASKDQKGINFNPHYRIDWDGVIGSHVNASIFSENDKVGKYSEKKTHYRNKICSIR